MKNSRNSISTFPLRWVCALVLAALLVLPGTVRAWWGNSYNTPSLGGTWATATDCGTYWYAYMLNTSCTGLGKSATFNPGFVWSGRGYIAMDWVDPGAYALVGIRLRYRNQDGGLPGTYFDRDGCAYTCAWRNVLGGVTDNLYNWNGIYCNGNESWTTGCGSACGVKAGALREIHMWGDKWVYLNDWIVFGGYGSSSVSDTSNRSFPWAEAGLYVYGAIDTTHGNYFANNLYYGKVPFRVTTGDCGQGNKLNFKGNASNSGNNNCDNCDAYAFAWVHTPSGAGPQLGVGADDGHRIWFNGSMVSDNNAYTGGWDSYNPGAKGLAAGWNRVLYKVHNGGGGFDGTLSLHHGTDWNQMEPSVSLVGDRYGGFSRGYEQDDWYPRIDVASFYGGSNPQPDGDYYGNTTTVAVSGTSSVTGPVPYWRTMQYQWGYGLSGDSDYADVSGTPTATSWTHNQTGVTGHRRFHFFAVSQSGRTSRQTSGVSGGNTWADGGAGNYMDVFIDNVAPVSPSFSSVAAASASQVTLAWAIPLDQGVNIANSATEATTGITSGGANGYVRGDVGIGVYRDGSAIYGWGTGTSISDTGLSANTPYTYTIAARDNTSQSRGAWANTTGEQGSTVAWTLSVPPTTSTVTRDNSFFCAPGTVVNWTAVGGFGPGKIHYYRYVWNQTPTHVWADTEAQWTTGPLSTTPTAGGNWYLHVKGYNGAHVGNGTLDYKIVVSQGTEKWVGGNGPWDTSTPGLWQDATPNAVIYCDGHDVLFDDSACGDPINLALQATVTPKSIVNDSKGNDTIPAKGQISGPAQLVRQDSSTVTLNPPNAYSDNSTMNASTLALSGSGPITTSPTIPVASGVTADAFALTSGFELAGDLPLTGTGASLGPVTIDPGATLAPGAAATAGTLAVSNDLALVGSARLPVNKSGDTLIRDHVAGSGHFGATNLPRRGLVGIARPEVNDPIAALTALATPASADESGQTLGSGVLPGTKVLALQTEGDTTTVEFSQEIIGSGLDEARLLMIFEQVRATLRQFGLEGSIRLQVGGKLLSSYLPPVTPVEPGPAAKAPPSNAKSISGRNICIGPSHGRFWNGSGWYWQRSDPCGYGEAVLEDTLSIKLAQFLYQYLTQDGATVHVTRELNESNCCNGYEGQPWWKMATYSWLRANGLPCSVWANSTGNCGEETATGRVNDDIRARPKFADYRGSEIYIAMHSNAGGGTGTETYRDTAMDYPAHETASYNLALAVHNNTIDAIREMYDGGWANRGVKDSAGGFGEIRIPNRPACLIELAFHDKCAVDALYLTDDFFRSVAEWGLYKGICSYFGTSPTWDKYSDQYVSDTIPSTMNAGQSYSVSVTFRNRGVLWREGRAFRLGAAGDSDPFTSTTRHTISGDVRPGNTYTFSFTMTAPTTPGTYTTDWRMVRDGVAWFGDTHSEQVTVISTATPPSITTQPASQTVNQGSAASFSVVATGTAPLTYQWRLNGTAISGATLSSYSKSDVQPADAGSYSVVVANAGGSVTSANALLTVVVPPSITTQPASQTVNQGSVASFSVVATGTAPLTYQWRLYGTAISGATLSSYSKSDVQPANAGNYSVIVANAAGSATSADALLTVILPPNITTQPLSQEVNSGSTVNFTVAATGSAPLSYQWRFNGADISGATLSSFTKISVQRADAGSYSVVVANIAGSATSENALLAVSCLGVSTAITLDTTVTPRSVTNDSTGDYTISGTGKISGSAWLTKQGASTLTLSTANDYSGATTVSGGKLVVNGAIGSGVVTVHNTATLGGNGAIGGSITVEAGGRLAPGASMGSIGTLTVSGHVTLHDGSAMGVEVDRNGGSFLSDKVQGIGTLTQGGTLYVTNNGATLEVGDSFTLFSAARYSEASGFAAIGPANPNDNEDLAWDIPALNTNGVLRVHRSPNASDKAVARSQNMSLKIKWSDLFASTDGDGDPVVLESFTAGSQNATITSNATYIFYLPNNNNDDEFNYTATDNRGGKRTKKITITVAELTGQAQHITVVDGRAMMSFAGIPGASYTVQRATDINFTQNLTTVLTTNAPAYGLFIIEDETQLPQAYYRLKYNP